MKQFHLGRRGEAEEMETLSLFDIIIGIAVAAIMILGVYSYTGMSERGKYYTENDLSLMVGSLLSSPGEIIARYPISPDYRVAGICSEDTPECKKIQVYTDTSSNILASFKKDNLIFKANPARGIYDIKRERQ